MGNNTYQLDFIIADTSEIPVIALGSDIAYVPVEAALATVEIKSTLRTKDREQIENQSRSILELKIVNFPEHGLDYGTDSKHVIPLFIFAYSTEVAEKTLDKWFEEIPNLLGICVINRFCKLSRSHIEGDNILREIVTYHGDDEFSETLSFISGIFDALSKVSSLRKKFTPILRAYIEAVAV